MRPSIPISVRSKSTTRSPTSSTRSRRPSRPTRTVWQPVLAAALQLLTAIVIGFALVCYSLVLLLRLMRDARTDDALALRHAEPVPDDPVKPPASAPACDVHWPPPKDGT